MNKPPYGGGEQKKLVNVEDSLCSIIMGIPTKEWDDLPSPGVMFLHTSPQEVLYMEPITYKFQEVFSHKKLNANIISVGDTILSAVALQQKSVLIKIGVLLTINKNSMP